MFRLTNHRERNNAVNQSDSRHKLRANGAKRGKKWEAISARLDTSWRLTQTVHSANQTGGENATVGKHCINCKSTSLHWKKLTAFHETSKETNWRSLFLPIIMTPTAPADWAWRTYQHDKNNGCLGKWTSMILQWYVNRALERAWPGHSPDKLSIIHTCMNSVRM